MATAVEAAVGIIERMSLSQLTAIISLSAIATLVGLA